jgi:hypothetical protein
MTPENLGNEKLLSTLKDPFIVDCITSVTVNLMRMGDTYFASGGVSFNNPPTSGHQSFTGEHFDDVVQQIKEFIKQLKDKQ